MSDTVSINSARGKWILLSAILASGLGFLMGSAVNIALPTLQRVLATDIAGVQWIANSYLLALSTFILMSGSLADMVGIRVIFTAGIGVFTAGAALSGAVSGMGGLIVFRTLQGVGAALMVPSSLAVINSSFPKSERGRAVGLWAGVSGAIAALGPFVGGFLVETSWRLVFLGMVPLGVLTLTVALLYVPAKREHRPAKTRRLDWQGSALAVIALGALSYGLIRLPERGLGLPVIVTLSAGLAGTLGFVLWERRADSPLVPSDLFNATVTGANLATFALYFAFLGTLFLVTFHLQQLRGYPPMLAGVALLPPTLCIAGLAGPSGAVTDRKGPRLQTVAGPLAVAAGLAILLFVDREGSYAPLYLLALMLLGTGMAGVIPAVTSAALEVDTNRSGTASGVNNAVARVAGLLAVVAAGSILHGVFSARLRVGLQEIQLDQAAVSHLLAQAGDLLGAELPGSLTEEQAQSVTGVMREAFVSGFRTAMVLNLLMAAAASAAAALLIHRRKKSGGG